MPVTGSRIRSHEIVPEYSSVMGLGHINTTGFLFGDDDDKSNAKKDSATSPDVKSYLQMNATDDKFPILVRRDEYPGLVNPSLCLQKPTLANNFLQLSASSAALDLALSQSPGPDAQSNGWTPFAHHHTSQHSLPQNIFHAQPNCQLDNSTSNGVSQQSVEAATELPVSTRKLNRLSMETALSSFKSAHLASQGLSNGKSVTRPNLANLQSSYSTSDLPTMKNINGSESAISPLKTHAQQHFHNHNASLGRIPPHAVSNRHSRELSGGETRREEASNGYHHSNSGLQASAAPFGPSISTTSTAEAVSSSMSPINTQQYPSPAYYGGYGMQLMNMGMTPMHLSNPMLFNNQMHAYQAQHAYSPYQNYGQTNRFPDSQARVIQQRRLQNGEGLYILEDTVSHILRFYLENARFTNVKLEHLQGEIYGLCKDQHGCRYLQKKLEERNPEHVHLIFLETNQHVVELMTGTICPS